VLLFYEAKKEKEQEEAPQSDSSPISCLL